MIFSIGISVVVIYFLVSQNDILHITWPSSFLPIQTTTIQQIQASPNSRNQNTPTHNPYPSPLALGNGWGRYTYTDAGYSVDYPQDCNLIESAFLDYRKVFINFPKTIDPDGATMGIYPFIKKEEKSLSQFADEEINHIITGKPPISEENNQKEMINVADHPALSFTFYQNCPMVILESSNMFYILRLIPNTMRGNIPTNESVDLFWRIIDTFKIL